MNWRWFAKFSSTKILYLLCIFCVFVSFVDILQGIAILMHTIQMDSNDWWCLHDTCKLSTIVAIAWMFAWELSKLEIDMNYRHMHMRWLKYRKHRKSWLLIFPPSLTVANQNWTVTYDRFGNKNTKSLVCHKWLASYWLEVFRRHQSLTNACYIFVLYIIL